MIADKKIYKQYDAIVIGKIDKHSTVSTPIKGQEAKTSIILKQCFPSKKFDHVSHVQLIPHTGRTHQLRIHLASIGVPIMGDRLYCPEHLLVKGKGLYLAATRLRFEHPISRKKLDIDIELPKKFMKIITPH